DRGGDGRTCQSRCGSREPVGGPGGRAGVTAGGRGDAVGSDLSDRCRVFRLVGRVRITVVDLGRTSRCPDARGNTVVVRWLVGWPARVIGRGGCGPVVVDTGR